MNAIVLAASSGRSFHAGGGFIILIVLVVAALSFAVVRQRNRQGARTRDEAWRVPSDRQEPGPVDPRRAEPRAAEPRAAAAEGAVAAASPVRMARPVAAPGDGAWAVETYGLTKRFGSNVAVNDVELLVPQ